MLVRRAAGHALALAFLWSGMAGTPRAEEPASTSAPRPVPVTRPEMKQLLEDMKARKPRIPLPEITEEETAKLGERAGYEGRLRYHYTPGGETRGVGGGFGGGREPDPNMTLDYAFKTQLFWIVSRTNNCQYCLGHQEWKLAATGMKEEEIAALDGDWIDFKPGQQAAFAFARKITFEPHRITDADIAKLKKHYTELQILEMLLSVAGNNSINRWKEGVGVPQSKEGGTFSKRSAKSPATETPSDKPSVFKSFTTPTADKYKDSVSKVAAIQVDEKTGAPTRAAVCRRPALESRSEVEEALAACRERTARLPLVAEDKARELLPDDWAKGPLPQWVRLLANFPRDGKSRILAQRNADERPGDLKPLMKAQAAWIIARQDRAWYATGLAKARLKELGWSDDQIYKLDGSWADFTPGEQSLFTLARKLAATPVVLTDDDVAQALKATGPREVVQMITYVTTCASFDRITEAAGLQLDK